MYRILLLLFAFSLNVNALRATGEDEAYRNSSVNPAGLDKQQWQKLASETNFDEVPPKEKKPQEEQQQPNYNNNGNGSGRGSSGSSSGSSNSSPTPSRPVGTAFGGPVMQVILYVLLIGGLVLLIIKLATGGWLLSNPSIENPIQRLPEELGADIPESELDKILRGAVSEGNYRLAVRLSFLRIMSKLVEKGQLKWRRDKTNNIYLRELSGHPHLAEIRNATRIYERVWFGETPIAAEDFNKIRPTFEAVLSKL